MHWCADSELDAVLSALAPFLRAGPQTSVASLSCVEHEHDVVALDHQDVRAAAVFRSVCVCVYVCMLMCVCVICECARICTVAQELRVCFCVRVLTVISLLAGTTIQDPL
jgi:hypothetical protein